jgi:hypothetical protein
MLATFHPAARWIPAAGEDDDDDEAGNRVDVFEALDPVAGHAAAGMRIRERADGRPGSEIEAWRYRGNNTLATWKLIAALLYVLGCEHLDADGDRERPSEELPFAALPPEEMAWHAWRAQSSGQELSSELRCQLRELLADERQPWHVRTAASRALGGGSDGAA